MIIVFQKDLTIVRTTIGQPNENYEYKLFHRDKFITLRRTDYEYNYGIVTLNPDSTFDLELKDLKNVKFSKIEDDNIFIVEVKIKKHCF